MSRWLAVALACAACSQETAPAAPDLGTRSHLPFAPTCHPPARNGTFVADSCPPPPAGRLVAAYFTRVIANYDNCPAVADGRGLWAVDENGNQELVIESLHETFAGPRSLTIHYYDYNPDNVSPEPRLAFWRRASGTVRLGNGAPLVFSFTDDNWVAFVADWDEHLGTGSLMVAALDCSGIRMLRGFDYYHILGSGGRVLAITTDVAPLTVRSYDPHTGDGLMLFADPIGMWPLRATRGGAVLDPNGGMPLIFPAAGGSGVPIGAGHMFLGGDFTHAGDAVIFVADNGMLLRAPVDGGAPTVLVPGGAHGVLALSPDDQWLVYATQWTGPSYAQASDAWLTSATNATLPVAIAATPTIVDLHDGHSVLGFTDDGSWVYWRDSVYHLRPVGDGDGERTIDNVHRLKTAGGARLVWDDDAGAVWALDLAAGGGAAMVAQLSNPFGDAAARWALSTDKKTVFYLQDDGLYAAPLP
jgi:hypothetical protein